jgi:hypothetical protein
MQLKVKDMLNIFVPLEAIKIEHLKKKIIVVYHSKNCN